MDVLLYIITELTYTGVTLPREYVANPVTAGALNILPGFGNFYLGVGNYAEPSYIVVGIINLLLWPISILWGVPEAYIDAQTINQRATVTYYLYRPKGKKELEALRQPH